MSEGQQQSHNRKPSWWLTRNKQKTAPKQPNNYAFIDSQNLNLGVQKIGWKMDWRKLRQWLTDTYGVTKAYMFIGYMLENESLYEQMHEHGFLVVLKPTLEIRQPKQDGQSADTNSKEDHEKIQVKGNVDADLVLYAMKELPNYDKAVIVSGDGDFFSLVEYLIEQKKLLKLMVPNRRFSSLFQNFESYIEGIDAHRNELAYRDFKHKKRETR